MLYEISDLRLYLSAFVGASPNEPPAALHTIFDQPFVSKRLLVYDIRSPLPSSVSCLRLCSAAIPRLSSQTASGREMGKGYNGSRWVPLAGEFLLRRYILLSIPNADLFTHLPAAEVPFPSSPPCHFAASPPLYSF